MKKRYLYCLLFLVTGMLISLIVTAAVVGTGSGFLWIFVLGDNSWPEFVERSLTQLGLLTFLGAWGAFIIAEFLTGKRLENDPLLNRNHILLSIALSIAPLLLILLHQYQVGNFGPKPDSMLCSEFCADNGYSTSGMPPGDSGDRDCICYDGNGKVMLKLSLGSLLAKESQ